ncbi:hypothetical protein DID75_02730, partial [Candidatus Marinamargulisbacteria bacterium SCGC AG-410-N11]
YINYAKKSYFTDFYLPEAKQILIPIIFKLLESDIEEIKNALIQLIYTNTTSFNLFNSIYPKDQQNAKKLKQFCDSINPKKLPYRLKYKFLNWYSLINYDISELDSIIEDPTKCLDKNNVDIISSWLSTLICQKKVTSKKNQLETLSKLPKDIKLNLLNKVILEKLNFQLNLGKIKEYFFIKKLETNSVIPKQFKNLLKRLKVDKAELSTVCQDHLLNKFTSVNIQEIINQGFPSFKSNPIKSPLRIEIPPRKVKNGYKPPLTPTTIIKTDPNHSNKRKLNEIKTKIKDNDITLTNLQEYLTNQQTAVELFTEFIEAIYKKRKVEK